VRFCLAPALFLQLFRHASGMNGDVVLLVPCFDELAPGMQEVPEDFHRGVALQIAAEHHVNRDRCLDGRLVLHAFDSLPEPTAASRTTEGVSVGGIDVWSHRRVALGPGSRPDKNLCAFSR
jgi:hypothetical protein